MDDNQKIDIEHCESKDMYADFHTKGVESIEQFHRNRYGVFESVSKVAIIARERNLKLPLAKLTVYKEPISTRLWAIPEEE